MFKAQEIIRLVLDIHQTEKNISKHQNPSQGIANGTMMRHEGWWCQKNTDESVQSKEPLE